jgi:hypothetical protein
VLERNGRVGHDENDNNCADQNRSPALLWPVPLVHERTTTAIRTRPGWQRQLIA